MEDFAVRGDREALRKIWLACFGGEEEYVDFYLRRRFRPSETVVWREKGVQPPHDPPPPIFRQGRHRVDIGSGAARDFQVH